MHAKEYAVDSQGREVMTPLYDHLKEYLTGNIQTMYGNTKGNGTPPQAVTDIVDFAV
jgi:hypothetical protein